MQPRGEGGIAAETRQGAVRADHFLALFYAIDKDDDEFDESVWQKANPLMDVNPHLLAAIRKEAIEAKQMPGKAAEFRIKRVNRQSSSAEGWIDLHKWQKCDGAVDLDALKDVPCWGGLDLSSTTDMTALRLVWRIGDLYLTWGRRWVPESAVKSRTQRGTVPYAAWVEAGLIEQTEGDVVDYAVIEAAVLDVRDRYNLQALAYDRWNASDICNRLVAAGVPMIEFRQGPQSYNPAMQELERAYVQGNLAHGGDPVLQWCASNLIARRDANMNMAPDKKKAPDKIDDMAALLEAIGVSQGAPSIVTLGSDYEMMTA